MLDPRHSDAPQAEPAGIDPRHSFGAAAMWLIVALTVGFSIAAAVWVGSIARANVLEQHVRRLSLETDQLSSELSQAITARLDAVRGAGAMSRAAGSDASGLGAVWADLTAAYPHLGWIAAVDPQGVVIASGAALHIGDDVRSSAWFTAGRHRPWLGLIDPDGRPSANSSPDTTELGDVAVPVRDAANRIVGVIAAHVDWQRAAHHPERLTDEPDPRITTEVAVLDSDGLVLVGPKNLRGKRWPGSAGPDASGTASTDPRSQRDDAPRFERLPDGRRVLVSRSVLAGPNEIGSLGWRVQLSEPNERVFQRADALVLRILWVSLGLGVLTAAVGIVAVRQLTRRLARLAVSVASLGRNPSARIEVPAGTDEVARLGRAFATLLDELAMERRELERRVAVRTREVERLADESRYAAIMRERLQIARDLHDTLAHSMMALLSEIRFLRKLQSRDPHAVTKELARAEAIAQEGLQEARSAITRMRMTAVRETGLGPALAEVFERFLNSTGVAGEFHAGTDAARFGDERAESIVRIVREALRNVERHAKASKVIMRLESATDDSLDLLIEDDGVGFDPLRIPPGHYGILGLHEQAKLIGAELDIRSSAGAGTTLCLKLRRSPVLFDAMAGGVSQGA